MLETIVSWIVSVIGELLDATVTGFLGMMNLSLASISSSFPALPAGYKMFQAIGLGLVVLIAGVQLTKFFLGPLAESRDTPVRIVLRASVATTLIWFGGHFIEIFVNLARIPYEAFVAYDPNSAGMTFSEMAENMGDLNLIDGATITLGGPATLVLALIVILIIGWNLLKLMVEVCERFLMIGVLAYASPLVYPTLSSQATSEIFKRYAGMFFGQCAIMTISAWMLKLVLSGFSFTATDTNILFRLLLTLALCKIAQRVDTYMQQLGIGVGTTGGNLVDEAIGMMALFGGGRTKGAGASSAAASGSDAPLGAGPDGSLSRFGGILGGVSNAAQKAKRDARGGAPMSEVGRNIGRNFAVGAGIAKGVDTIKSAVKDKNLNGIQRVGKVGKGVAQAAGGLLISGSLANTAHNFQEARENARRQATRDATAGAANFNQRSKDTRYQNPDEPVYADPNGRGYDNSENMSGAGDAVRDEQRASMQTASQFFASQRAAHGVGGFAVDQDGNASLDETAQRAGLRLDMGQDDPMVEGRDDVVGDFMSKNYQEAAKNDEMQEYLLNTVQNGSALAAEQALNNPYNNLEGNDELGDALLKKAYGEQAITGKPDDELGGTFENISAETVGEDGRIIHADYVDKDGVRTHYDLQNAEAMDAAPTSEKLRQFRDGVLQRGPEPIEAAGSNAAMYVQRTEAMDAAGDANYGPDRETPVSAPGVPRNVPPHFDSTGSEQPISGSDGSNIPGDVRPVDGSGAPEVVPPTHRPDGQPTTSYGGAERTVEYGGSGEQSAPRPTEGPVVEVHSQPRTPSVPIVEHRVSDEWTRDTVIKHEGRQSSAPSPDVKDALPWRRKNKRQGGFRQPNMGSGRDIDLRDFDDDDFV